MLDLLWCYYTGSAWHVCCIWHGGPRYDILFNIMESSFGVGGTVLSWIRSFLQGRTQQLYSGGKASNVATVTSGVPQGSVLGPLFFILYIAWVVHTTHLGKEFNLNVHWYICRRRSVVWPPSEWKWNSRKYEKFDCDWSKFPKVLWFSIKFFAHSCLGE